MLGIRRSAFALSTILCACAQQPHAPTANAAAAGTMTPPVARRVDVVDHEFGLTLPDPYRWMEGENNAEFDAWLKAQAEHGRKQIDATPTLAAWRERLAKVAGAMRTHYSHQIVAGKLFFERRSGGTEAVLMYRDASGEHTIYDPNEEKGATISNFSVSPDARLVTINVGRNGNEIGDIELREVASGKLLADKIEPVWSEFNPSWLTDGSGYIYTAMTRAGSTDPLQGMASRVHKIGEPQSADRLLVEADGKPPLRIAPETFPRIEFDPQSRWAMLGIGGARSSSRICVAPRAQVLQAAAPWRCVADFDDEIQGGALHGDTLYLIQGGTKHPNRRLLALDLRKDKALAAARETVAERSDTVLEDVGAARDALYLSSLRNGLSVVERLGYAGKHPTELALPFAGTAGLRTDTRVDGCLLTLTGWTQPMTAYRVEAGKPLTDIGLGAMSPADYTGLVAEEIEATSADGTHVPMSLVRRRDQAQDGHALGLVEGYGGYGLSSKPFFSPMRLEWAKAGNVYVACHVRGGGEKGEAWRLGGAGANKQRGVEDFIACSRELEKRGYSHAARTAGWGTSMGGVLAGGAYTTPDSGFGAMLIKVGELNPSRLLAAKNGANQIAEVGDPRTEGGLKQLAAMDPVQRVKPGAHYVPLLLSVGLTDQRVAPWNSGKFAATVMAASPATPVWIRSADGTGHFATTASAQALEIADYYAALEALLAGAQRRQAANMHR